MKYLLKTCLMTALVVMFSLPMSGQRTVKTINDNWEFRMPDKEDWVSINVPHTYNEDAYRGREYYKGKAYYRRMLNVADVESGKRYFLKFDGVNKAADVTVNGVAVGSHAGGYSSFAFDITDCIKEENLIEVTVDNGRKDVTPLAADFTFFGGIYRDVWLIETEEQHFNMTDLGVESVFVSTPSVSDNAATVKVVSNVSNDGSTVAKLEVKSELYGPDGSLVKSVAKKVKVGAGETLSVESLIEGIEKPQLWSPETPILYKVETTLVNTATKAELDKKSSKLGFRWFSFDPNEGFSLNGKPYKLRGVNRHQDQYPLGIALDDEAHRRDVKIIKDLGCNFFRIAHYPQDDAILEACDELGILAWEEIPVINYVPDTPGYADNCEVNLREMIRQHYNHPAVIAWGYMNEILLISGMHIPGYDSDKDRKLAVELAQRLEAVVKEEDSSRVSVMAFSMDKAYPEIGLNLVDVVGWNLYHGWYTGQLSDFDAWCKTMHEQYPEDPIIISEWGAGSDRRLHSDKAKIFDFSTEYQQTYVEHYLKVIEETPYLAGCTYWNLIDFNVATRQESMPRVNNKGLVFNNREYKDVAYYFKSMWRKDVPVIRIASRAWDKRIGKAGQKQRIKVYSNMAEVELLVNGKSVGKQTLENCNTVFEVELAEGNSTLVAKGVFDGTAAEDAMTIEYSLYPELSKGDELAINVGSNCFFTSDVTNLTWLPDQEYAEGGWGYIGGEDKSTTSEIVNTQDGPVYQTWRQGEFSYKIDAPAGEYEVELLMADTSKPNSRQAYLLGKDSGEEKASTVMEITICGETVEPALSVAQESHYLTAFKRRYMVENIDGQLTIEIKALSGEGFLSGIKVRRVF